MKKLLKVTSITVGLLALSACFLCYAYLKKNNHKQHTGPQKTKDYYLSMQSFADFTAIQGNPLSNKFNDVLSVKLVYDISDKTLYFIQSTKYRYHNDFCREVLGDDMPLELYNVMNYGSSSARKYYLANLNCYTRSHIYALEFSSEDRIDAAQIKTLFQSVLDNSYLGDSLQLLISSDYLLGLNNAGKLDMKKAFPTDIYNGQKYQLLNPGITYGILRRAEDVRGSLSSAHDVLLFKGTPIDVPVCAGILTNSYQTPLSHINILCHNRNIPSAVDVDIYSKQEVIDNIGKPIKLVVNKDGITISTVAMREVDNYWKNFAERKPSKLKCDITFNQLIPVARMGLDIKHVIGNKAAGFGELNKIANKMTSSFNVPEGGFAIPFYFYYQHVSKPAVKVEFDALAKLKAAGAADTLISAQLKRIRKAIKEQPMDAGLLTEVKKMIAVNGKYTSYRFRSSSNAEDIEGFSGAGLYESKTGKLDDTDKPIDMAIKKVWASVWNDNAYNEREVWHIDESTVMMGILAHRNFPNESANGVAITKNLYRQGFPGYTVNVQKGEVPVVSPPDSVTCEQFICMNANEINIIQDEITIDYITYSNITNNKLVLTKKQVGRLYNSLAAAQKYFTKIWAHDGKLVDDKTLALDIEFKFDDNGKLYLKQARPYK